jgi:DGQHR domain-containing protein
MTVHSESSRTPIKEGDRLRYSISLVTQGSHRFYTLTMPTEVLAKCCYVTSREEDPITGFQRVLDKKRAQEIADYMDKGFGTIPSSIVLSAQPDAELTDNTKNKTIEFTYHPKSFLVLDGQHRVYGFSLANTNLRVPVVIYNKLTRQEESKLFIDINTKQRPVPNELLLDIKKLAEDEDDNQALLSELFDSFNLDGTSPLLGLMSPAKRQSNKISRVTFNNAVKSVLPVFSDQNVEVIFPTLRAYIAAILAGLNLLGAEAAITNPIVFRSLMDVFPNVAERVSDRFGKKFSEDDFAAVLEPMFSRAKSSWFLRPPKSYKDLSGNLANALKNSFSI